VLTARVVPEVRPVVGGRRLEPVRTAVVTSTAQDQPASDVSLRRDRLGELRVVPRGLLHSRVIVHGLARGVVVDAGDETLGKLPERVGTALSVPALR
jgi:hypothetical protein